jgi:hypothetical protein
MEKFSVIDSLSELDDAEFDNVHGILKLYGMTYGEARRFISREQYREGTVEFHKAMKAKMMICKAEIKDMYSVRQDPTEELRTPPLTRR